MEYFDKTFIHSIFLDHAEYYLNDDSDNKGQLSVTLKDKRVYTYYNVPLSLWDMFTNEKIANKIFRTDLNRYNKNPNKNEKEYMSEDLEFIYAEVMIKELCDLFLQYWGIIRCYIESDNFTSSEQISKNIWFSFNKKSVKYKKNKQYYFKIFSIDEINSADMLEILCNVTNENVSFDFIYNSEPLGPELVDKMSKIDEFNKIKRYISDIIKKDVKINIS